MVKAREAQQWAKEEFTGIMDTLYTPWTKDDEVDEAALRKLVRYFLVDLKCEGIWYCGHVAECYFMTMAEKKKVAKIVVDEARKAKPKTIVIACISGDSAKDCVELTNHSAELGADMAVINTPRFLYGEEGILSWFGYVAEHTDIALSFFQRGPWILSPQLLAKMSERWPAFCAIKDSEDPNHSVAIMEMTKGRIRAYNTQTSCYLSGMVQKGQLARVLHGIASWRLQVPPDLKFRDFWDTVLRGDSGEAARKYYGNHFFHMQDFWFRYSQRGHGWPGVNMHHAALEKYWATLLGMPMGTGGWQTCRPGGAGVSEALQKKCKEVLTEAGLIKR